MEDQELNLEDPTVLNRLIRIETRIVKIMEALNLDPKTGKPAQRKQKKQNKPPHERNIYDIY